MTKLGNENLCADEETTKRRAYAIKERMKELGHQVPLAQVYEILATSCGYRNWPTMKAALQEGTRTSQGATASAVVLPEIALPVFRLADGTELTFQSLFPHKPGSVDFVFGPPGRGKSVLMQAMAAGEISQEIAFKGWDGLPEIGIIDIGHSAKGLVNFLREKLPAELRPKVAYHALKMRRSHAINPFDTPLGFRGPTSDQSEFLVNFLLTVLHGAAARDSRDKLRQIIDAAYRGFSDQAAGAHPKKYVQGVNKFLDEEIRSRKLPCTEGMTTWWTLVDLFEHENLHKHALVAQRYAVPLLADVAAVAEGLYPELVDKIRDVLHYVPVLASETRFERGDGQIVVLDLFDVAPLGGGLIADSVTGVMFLLARHVLQRDTFGSVVDLGSLRSPYREHHIDRLRRSKARNRLFVFDELHRVSNIVGVRDQIKNDVVTAKSNGIRIRLGSQLVESFSDMAAEATGVFILGANPRRSSDVSELFGLSHEALEIIERDLIGPTRCGVPFLAVRKDGGHFENLVRYELPTTSIWAYSTCIEDQKVKEKLGAILGLSRALEVLAARYPAGSIKSEIETRMRVPPLNAGYSMENIDEILNQFVAELAALA